MTGPTDDLIDAPTIGNANGNGDLDDEGEITRYVLTCVLRVFFSLRVRVSILNRCLPFLLPSRILDVSGDRARDLDDGNDFQTEPSGPRGEIAVKDCNRDGQCE